MEQQTVLNKHTIISNFYSGAGKNETTREILTGLTVGRKYISSKFFYDDVGSMLFEAITRLPEYYPSRTEKSILTDTASDLVTGIEHTDIVELGSGDCSKISILLNELPDRFRTTIRYLPVDISQIAIRKSAGDLRKLYPEIFIHGLAADFLSQLDDLPLISNRNKLICFFGSTLGNLSPRQAVQFLSTLRQTMRATDRLLLGLDMVKEKNILEKAYNDNAHVTAAFNRNILNVVNRLVGTDFDPDDFEHRAFYNEVFSRIEMHLVARYDIEIYSARYRIKIKMRRGETIHTENSYKFTADRIKDFAMTSGLKIRNIFTDDNRWFSLVDFGG
jgi:L-histidine N-alpha-methyltransferase